MKDDLLKFGIEPVENLANASVAQAVSDLADAMVEKYKAELLLRNANNMIYDCKSFFASEWYKQLTTVEPEKLKAIARTQADYMIWQKRNGCSSQCKIKDCPHRIRKANWEAWSKGEKTCFKKQEERRRKHEK